jgi:hypothetical protein
MVEGLEPLLRQPNANAWRPEGGAFHNQRKNSGVAGLNRGTNATADQSAGP